jgi:hypothetical protein
MEPLLIVIVSICAGIMVVLISIRLREPVIDRRNARVSAINGEITRLDSLGSHLDWNQELLEMNAFLRGLGERQKAKAFMQTVGQVPTEKRAEAAKRFLRGMLGEARER